MSRTLPNQIVQLAFLHGPCTNWFHLVPNWFLRNSQLVPTVFDASDGCSYKFIHIGYDIVSLSVTYVLMFVWFAWWWEWEYELWSRVWYSPCYLIGEIGLLFNKMYRHYVDNAFFILTVVSGCDWHWIHWACDLDVWLLFDLNFALYRLWGWWADFHLEMWVGDYSGRNITALWLKTLL